MKICELIKLLSSYDGDDEIILSDSLYIKCNATGKTSISNINELLSK